MVKLERITGLPIKFDRDNYSLVFDEDQIRVSKVRRYKIRNLRPYVLNRELKYPIDVYLTYSNIAKGQTNNLSLDITIIPPNLLGIEYVKTVPKKVPERKGKFRIVHTLYGSATLLIQDREDQDAKVYLTRLEAKNFLMIPAGYYYNFVNTRSTPLLIAEYYAKNLEHAASLKKMKGMGYYVISKNAKQEIVKNPHYKQLEKITKMKYSLFNKEFWGDNDKFPSSIVEMCSKKNKLSKIIT
ncbi:hypothetical protein KC660_01305 [Candidatus Dojkabacteria bacterium]|uniref:glucose-6-phosphate isomerase n=1 Tax=Candidatus Dojkabacteria bacterium TaxID=2099670 RepID=A0A955L365_9BACT|nr:hypothetical protein [Candidatus Dojkabacteria bacterium]